MIRTENITLLPQVISEDLFENASKLLHDRVVYLSDDIVVQGSRASGTAKVTSDIDIAIRVPKNKFEECIEQFFKLQTLGLQKREQ